MRKTQSQEEKTAKTLSKLVSDLTLDIEQVGVYVARNSNNVQVRRLTEITEAANYEKEKANVRNGSNYLF